jgi:prepilin-type processing-associated H-X9-DG protein
MVLGQASPIAGPGAASSDPYQFSSQHAAPGVNFVFADGHVSYLKATMNPQTYCALSTRAGDEEISGDY